MIRPRKLLPKRLREAGVRSLIPKRLLLLPRDFGYVWGPMVMSTLRRWWVIFRNPHATIVFGRGTYVGRGFSLHIPGEATFVTGPNCEFRRDFRCELEPGAKVRIGTATRFTYNVLIQCATKIEFGDRIVVGQSSAVFDGSHRFRDPNKPLLDQGYDYRAIRVGDDAAIMTKCTIIADVGEHTFVGANSVVTRDLPPYVLAVGVPAKPIDEFGPAEPTEAATT
jgi:acetyltransferase-like isoleucine patch superfamily enzyme